MPDGSSSAAPVTMPGPRRFQNARTPPGPGNSRFAWRRCAPRLSVFGAPVIGNNLLSSFHYPLPALWPGGCHRTIPTMFISDFAIRRPIITVVTTIALVVFGIAALARLQIDEFPDIDAPIVFIGIPYPGASPDQVEREVVDRIEDRVAAISGLDILRSTSTDGFAQIIAQFQDRKSTRLNSSHTVISYAVFCLKKKRNPMTRNARNA